MAQVDRDYYYYYCYLTGEDHGSQRLSSYRNVSLQRGCSECRLSYLESSFRRQNFCKIRNHVGYFDHWNNFNTTHCIRPEGELEESSNHLMVGRVWLWCSVAFSAGACY